MVTGYLVKWSGSFTSAFIVTGGIAVAGALAVAVFVKAPAVLGVPGGTGLGRAPNA